MGHSTDSGFVRTHTTLAKYGKVHLIEPKTRSEHAMPSEAVNPGDVYASVDADGNPLQITVYGEDRKKLYDIDIGHDHSGGDYPDGHIQRYDENGIRNRDYEPPDATARRYVYLLRNGVEKDRKRGLNYGYRKRKN